MKYNVDLQGCTGVKHFSFDTVHQRFRYSVLVAGHEHWRDDASEIHLDDFSIRGGGDGAGFLKVDFNCLKEAKFCNT